MHPGEARSELSSGAAAQRDQAQLCRLMYCSFEKLTLSGKNWDHVFFSKIVDVQFALFCDFKVTLLLSCSKLISIATCVLIIVFAQFKKIILTLKLKHSYKACYRKGNNYL